MFSKLGVATLDEFYLSGSWINEFGFCKVCSPHNLFRFSRTSRRPLFCQTAKLEGVRVLGSILLLSMSEYCMTFELTGFILKATLTFTLACSTSASTILRLKLLCLCQGSRWASFWVTTSSCQWGNLFVFLLKLVMNGMSNYLAKLQRLTVWHGEIVLEMPISPSKYRAFPHT